MANPARDLEPAIRRSPIPSLYKVCAARSVGRDRLRQRLQMPIGGQELQRLDLASPNSVQIKLMP